MVEPLTIFVDTDERGHHRLANQLDEQLRMLKELDVLNTCSECLNLVRGDDCCVLEELASCGHSFCLDCINHKLERVPLSPGSSLTSSHIGFHPSGTVNNNSPHHHSQSKLVILSSDDPDILRGTSPAFGVRCSTCSRVSRHTPAKYRHHLNISNNNPPPKPPLPSRFNVDQPDHQPQMLLVSPMSIVASLLPTAVTTSSFCSSAPNISDDGDGNGDDKKLVLRSASHLQLFMPSNRLQILVKDLFGRTTLVVINAEDTLADLKRKLAQIFNLPVAELQVRFFQSPSLSDNKNDNNSRLVDDDTTTAAQWGIFNRATLRLINTQPSTWWRAASTAASGLLATSNPFATQTAPLFDRQ